MVREYIQYLENQAQSAFNISQMHSRAIEEMGFDEMNVIERFMNRNLFKHMHSTMDVFERLFTSYSRECMYATLILKDREMIELSSENEFFSGTNRVIDIYEEMYGPIGAEDESE